MADGNLYASVDLSMGVPMAKRIVCDIDADRAVYGQNARSKVTGFIIAEDNNVFTPLAFLTGLPICAVLWSDTTLDPKQVHLYYKDIQFLDSSFKQVLKDASY